MKSRRPEWLTITDHLNLIIGQETFNALEARNGPDPNINVIPECAAIHLAHSLGTSMWANEQGHHSTALCLMRQCIECLTIIDVGLQEVVYGDQILNEWQCSKRSQGDIRKQLERDVWPRYGRGLWNETWAQFFTSLTKAVQPYTHYSPELQNWQIAILGDGSLNYRRFFAAIGIQAYDPMKATRITLLHSLVIWTLGRVLVENRQFCGVSKQDVRELGRARGVSPLLSGGSASWQHELLPHLFFREWPTSL
jgi:hypothetical protein